jgi:SAM-dependent methyltransferase
MSRHAARHASETWKTLAPGAFALERSRDLLRALLAGWPRRSRSMLVFNVGDGIFLETLWEAGFDVTGQERNPKCRDRAQKRLGSRADVVLASPDHLPFDDRSFDYAAAVFALEHWDDPAATLEEIGRVVCGGLIVVFPSAWSLFGLECRLRKGGALHAALRPLLRSPRSVCRLLRRAYGVKKTVWSSILPGPSHTWVARSCCKALNAPCLPLPLGAFAGARVDFGPQYAGTPLLLRDAHPVASLELAAPQAQRGHTREELLQDPRSPDPCGPEQGA